MKKGNAIVLLLLASVFVLVGVIVYALLFSDSKETKERTNIDMSKVVVPESNKTFEDLPDYNPSTTEKEVVAKEEKQIVAGEKQQVIEEKDEDGFYRVSIDRSSVEEIKKKNDKAEAEKLAELEVIQKQIEEEYNFSEEANEEKFCAVYHLENKIDENGAGADVYGRGYITYPFFVSGQKTISQTKESVPKIKLNKKYDLISTKYYLYSPNEETFHEVIEEDNIPSNSCVIVSYQVNLKN